MNKQKQIVLLASLIMVFFTINYPFLNRELTEFLDDSETGKVDRVIDGDTIVVNDKSVRLLGMNSPERGEFFYEEAKIFLEKMVLNKTVQLKKGKEKYDLYNRTLAYIFLNRENINIKIVEEGLANFYFPSGKDEHYESFVKAWEICVQNRKNLCEKSESTCAECIKLKILNYEKQEVVFENICNFDCNLDEWKIKDEGRKKFVFENFVLGKKKIVSVIVGEGKNNETTLFWTKEEYVWTKTGDTLFLKDKEGKLVLYKIH